MDMLSLAALLIGLLFLLLGTGLWISLSLAAVGYVGMLFVSDTPGLRSE